MVLSSRVKTMLMGLFWASLATWALLGCGVHKESVTSTRSSSASSPSTPPASNIPESKLPVPSGKQESSTEPKPTLPSQSLGSKTGTPSAGAKSEPETGPGQPEEKKTPQTPSGTGEKTLKKAFSDKGPEQIPSGKTIERPPAQAPPPEKSSGSSPDPNIERGVPVLRSPSEESSPVLTPQISDHENGQMIKDFTTRIKETEQLLTKVNQTALTKEQHDTWVAVQNFLLKAKEAFSQKDFSMALNLAEKAHTLAREIVSNAPK